MLTAVGYFPAVMDWKARRKLLLDMCGDVRDEDVIASTPEISELPGMLGGHTVDDYLKVAKSRKITLKKEIDTIPARITENENAASGALTAEETAAVEEEISMLEQREKDIAAKISACNTPSAADERRNVLRQELEKRRAEYLSDYNKRIGAYNSRLSELTEKRDELYSRRSPLLVKMSGLPRQIEEMRKQRNKLQAECAEIGYDSAAIKAHPEVLVIEYGRPGKSARRMSPVQKNFKMTRGRKKVKVSGRRKGKFPPQTPHIKPGFILAKDKAAGHFRDRLLEIARRKWNNGG